MKLHCKYFDIWLLYLILLIFTYHWKVIIFPEIQGLTMAELGSLCILLIHHASWASRILS